MTADEDIRNILAFGLAAGARNVSRGHYAVGPQAVEVMGPNSPIVRAMIDHLIPSEAVTSLTIHVVEGGGEAGASPPVWNLRHEDDRHLERIHIASDNSLIAQYDPDRKMWSILDRQAARGLLWIEDLTRLPSWDIAAPFRALLNWFLAPSPLAIVHAGAVAVGDTALLLVGPGGSGKSTTVAAHLALGLPGLGDDLVIAGFHEDKPSVFALYDALKLDAASRYAARFGLSAEGSMTSGDKRVYRYSAQNPELLVRSRRLKAILTVEVGNADATHIAPMGSGAVLRALAPSTLFLMRGAERASLAKMTGLVRALPCYAVRLGKDPLEAARALSEWAATVPDVS